MFAQSANGASYSKCYVAQDGDLEISVLPATLNQQVQFIYVTPWRWTSKKGIAGNPRLGLLNLNWWYDWMTVLYSQLTNQIVVPMDSTLPGDFFN